jgi:hypothetical protein
MLVGGIYISEVFGGWRLAGVALYRGIKMLKQKGISVH